MESESPKRILAVFAHPDDETLLAGALIAKWASMGHRVDLLCLAPGDDNDLTSRMELAATDLGITSVSSLRFRPLGSNETLRHSAPPILTKAPERVVVERIVGKLKDLSPEIILTHSQYGDYGHPDHAFTHRVTLKAAIEATPDTEVYVLAWQKRMVRIASRMGAVFGARAETAVGFDFAHELTSATPLTDKINVKPFLANRKRAARHYSPEIAKGPMHMRILETAPVWMQSLFLGHTRLSRLR